MAVTRLKRKGRRNKLKSSQRISSIKLLTARPVIKNVDIEALKQEFSGSGESKSAPKAKKEEAADTTESK